MKKIITLFLLVSFTYAASSLSGEGKFISQDDDSLTFIKQQLISDAFKQVIDSEMKAMGLDTTVFWKNYESKFLESFEAIETNIESKYLPKEGEALSKEQQEKKAKEIREKRLIAKAKFGRLKRAIKSYSVTKMSKSVRIPNSHYMNITAQVDRKDLTDIYYKFIGVSKYRELSKIILDINYNLIDTNWFELGVESESDFTNVISKHWKDKIEEKILSLIPGGVEIITESKKKEIKERLKKSKMNLIAQNSSSLLGDEYENTLYISVELMIKKTSMDTDLGKITLNFLGGFNITDLKDNTIISHYDFPPEKSTFETKDQHKLNSSIATLIYRLPMLKFSEMRKIVEENVKNNQSLEIVLRKTKSVNDAFGFITRLKEKGLLFYFDSTIKEITANEIKLEVSFSGEKQRAIDVLNKMISEKISDNRIVTRDSALPFSFNIVDIEKKEEPAMKAENLNNGN